MSQAKSTFKLEWSKLHFHFVKNGVWVKVILVLFANKNMLITSPT